ncbi:MAG TPA: hypothetical protein VHA56_02990 [Mucilaginibacter sp.]|nr:hypothetical protein [Mucilaginibacter sp.]
MLVALPALAGAQVFGGDPPSVKWQQVNTASARVIFPQGLDSLARRVAAIVQQMNGYILPTIGPKQKPVNIVLQNQTTISNAYVGLAPFRSEFYLTPEQNSFEIGSLPWHEQLAIHEFRHVQQYNNFNVGVSHILKVLFGEGGQALANNLSIPDWFFEGDAVFNETYVSDQGRGRLPYFFNGFRALWESGRDYNYMKLRNGSYRDYTPDWYPLGYMLVSYGRQQYGNDFWKRVTKDAASYTWGFYPLQQAVRHNSGLSFETFRNNAFKYFKNEFKIDTSKNLIYNHNLPEHFTADEEFPAWVNDSTLIYLKSSYDYRPVFIEKRNNGERRIAVRDISIDNYFSYHDNKIVYSAYRPDLRWGYRNYSELMLLDVKSGKEQRLTSKTRYFSPSFSPDGRTLVTVEEATTGKSHLVLLDAGNGKLLSVIPERQNLYYTYPQFYGNKKIISAVRDTIGKMSLVMIDIQSGAVKTLLPFSFQPVAFPKVKNDTVYFSASFGTQEDLFALSIPTSQLYRLKNRNIRAYIGKYEPAISQHKLAWVSFTAAGYKINSLADTGFVWEKIAPESARSGLTDFGITALGNGQAADMLKAVKAEPLQASKYPRLYHPLNFHSIIPDFSDPNYQISLAGENILNTLQTNISFNYNRDEGYKEFGADAIYGAWFPYVSLGANYTADRRGYYKGGNVYWNETQIRSGLQVPLNLSYGKNLTYLNIGSGLVYANTSFQEAYRSLFADRSYIYSSNFVSFSHSVQRARKNIYPKFQQSLLLRYRSALTGLSADQFLASGALIFPGVFVNHSLVITAAHQQKDKNNIISFSNDFPFSRGYTAENLHNMNKWGVSYHLPLLYPDAGFANLVYLLRVRGDAFYDYTTANDFLSNGTSFKSKFRSGGAEIYFDTKFFNQTAITFGFRYSYLIDEDIFGGSGRNRFELIVPVTIF